MALCPIVVYIWASPLDSADQAVIESELRRMLAYAASAGQGLSETEITQMAEAAAPGRGGTFKMTLVEKWLAEGRVEGRVEGRAEGLHDGIEALLDARFGHAGLALVPQIRRITSIPHLQTILQTIRRASSVEEVRQGLLQD